MAWTTPRTWTDGELVTKAIMDPHVRDNFLAVGPHLIVRKTADESVTSSTVLQNDDVLLFPVAANEIWLFRLGLVYTGIQATGDIKLAFTFPAAGEIAASAVLRDASGTFVYKDWTGTTTPSSSQIAEAIGATVKRYLPIEGIFINAGTGGNVTLQWAQGASNATATTMRINSTLWAVKLA